MTKNYLLTFIALLVMHLSAGQPEFHEDSALNLLSESQKTYTGTQPENAQEEDIEGFKMFPNPVTDGYVTITTRKNLTKTVSIFDVLGKEVLKTTITGNTLDVTRLTAGVYLMKVTEDKSSITRKLVIR